MGRSFKVRNVHEGSTDVQKIPVSRIIAIITQKPRPHIRKGNYNMDRMSKFPFYKLSYILRIHGKFFNKTSRKINC